MKLIVEEEYGFRYWLWNVEGTKDEIQSLFKKVTGIPTYYAERGDLGGEWKQVEWEECRELADSGEYDGFAHIHNDDDSKLHWNSNLEII